MRELGNFSFFEHRYGIIVEVFHVFHEHSRGGYCQRTVQYNRNIRIQPARSIQSIEVVEQCLSAPDGESRNDEVAAPVHSVIDRLQKCRFAVIKLMCAVPVGGFHHKKISTVHIRRVAYNRLIWLSQIPRKNQSRGFFAFTDVHGQCRRTKYVSGLLIFDTHIGQCIERLVVRNGRQVLYGFVGIFDSINRYQRLFAAPPTFAAQYLGITLLNMSRVGEHNADQFASCLRGVNLPRKPARRQFGQQTAMIYMSMGQEDKLYLGGGKRKFFVVKLTNTSRSLEQTAINQKLAIFGFQEKT